MIATDFVYDGERLSDYGMIVCSFDGSQDGEVSSGADISFQMASGSGTDKSFLYNSKYDDMYSAPFSICKNPCLAENADDPYLSTDELRRIQRWLSRRGSFYRFEVDDPQYADVYWMGSFACQQYLIGGKVAGLTVTLYTNAPYGYKDEITLTYDLKANDSFLLYSQSDEEGYLYPSLSIQFNENAPDFLITNNRDNRVCQIKNCVKNEMINIDGDVLLITSNNSDHAIASDFNYFFPRIFTTYYDNENIYHVSHACKIILKYSPACKLGL